MMYSSPTYFMLEREESSREMERGSKGERERRR